MIFMTSFSKALLPKGAYNKNSHGKLNCTSILETCLCLMHSRVSRRTEIGTEFRADFLLCLVYCARKGVSSIPRIHQQEVPDVAVLDPVPALVNFVHRNDVLGEIIPDAVESAEFTLHGIL